MSEDDVKNYYEQLQYERDRRDIMRGRCHAAVITSRMDTVLTVLEKLNIKIEGVNYHEQS